MHKSRYLLVKFFLIFNFFVLNNIFAFDKGAGVLPYCYKNDTVWFLFAQDRRDVEKLWGDFGGKAINAPEDAMQKFYAGSYGLLTGHELNPFDLKYVEHVMCDLYEKIFRALEFNNLNQSNYTLFISSVNYIAPNFILAKRNWCDKNVFYASKYSRRIGYAWINIQELKKSINILKDLKKQDEKEEVTNVRENLIVKTQEVSSLDESRFIYVQGQEEPYIIINKDVTQYLLSEKFLLLLKELS